MANANGTGTLAGTPAAGTAGTYALTFGVSVPLFNGLSRESDLAAARENAAS